jgi:hypothetical protein
MHTSYSWVSPLVTATCYFLLITLGPSQERSGKRLYVMAIQQPGYSSFSQVSTLTPAMTIPVRVIHLNDLSG